MRWVWLGFAITAAFGLGEDKSPSREQAQEAVRMALKKLGVAQPPPLVALEDPSFKITLPGWYVFALRYPQFPVARVPPEPLRSSNLFFVSPQSQVEVVTEREQLRAFFLKHVQAESEKTATSAAQAWLVLASELRQDGFYQFRLVHESLVAKKTDKGLLASGRIEVVPKGGNQGLIAVEMLFSPKGQFVEVREEVKLKPGIRPICQATKLLDADPIVRRMAEQDLVVLGQLALPYLDEQWQKADANLRQAIERIRRLIEERER